MMRPVFLYALLLGPALAAAFTACGDPANPAGTDDVSAVSSAPSSDVPIVDAPIVPLTIYKSPTCGCCEDWITHMEASGFSAHIEHPSQLARVKSELGIAPEHSSCHTGVSEDGFVFEGHVPAKLVQRFLENPPEDALGLSVPRMPVGSPGMEMGQRFEPYDVLLLKTDGSSERYARIDRPEQQY